MGYVPENANNKIEVWSSQSNNINYPAEKLVKDSLDLKLDSSAYNAEDILSKLKTVDGPSSGLDADLLDSRSGTFYLDWDNATNKPGPNIEVILSGDVSGTSNVTLTNLENGVISIVTSVADDSHNHTIENVDGLQTSLNFISEELSSHTGNNNNPHETTASQVGLGNVDNTSDENKPVSTAQLAAIDIKANNSVLISHTGNNNNPHETTASQVGLGNVDNTSDSTKSVLSANTALHVSYSGLIGIPIIWNQDTTGTANNATHLNGQQSSFYYPASNPSNFISGITYNSVVNALGFNPENNTNKNVNNGYCGLDSGGKVPVSRLPATLLKYVGTWNASTNTPTLTATDTTKEGFVYNVSVAGTQFGISFHLGDWAIYNGSGVIEKSDNSDDVTSVNGQTGVVTISLADLGGLAARTAITAGTHTKIEYGADGLVTGGSDATTADFEDSSDKRFCTDAEKTKITNSISASSTDTLTNKRTTRRSGTANAPGATPTLNTDTYDYYSFTGLATAITSMTTGLTGSPVRGDMLQLDFTDNGTARVITWGTSFTSSGTMPLPLTTVTSTTLSVILRYETEGSGANKWNCKGVA